MSDELKETSNKGTSLDHQPFSMNAPGPFYVEHEACLACGAPETVAPGLMAHDKGHDGEYYHCFFKRQPSTPEEVAQAISAIQVACCESIRYAGNDPKILQELSHSKCGHLIDLSPYEWRFPKPGEVPAGEPDPMWDQVVDG